MKKNLTNLIVLALFLPLSLFASTYEWSATASKKRAFTNEAIYLKYVCKFSDRGELYSISFNPVTQNENYTVVLLSDTTKIRDSKRINSYEFVAFVHKPISMAFEFEALMKKTNKDSIENTVIGRDNEEYEEFTKEYVKQKSLLVEVADANTAIAGQLKLIIKKDEAKVKAYEPYHLELLFDGVANFQDMKNIPIEIEGVKTFTQEPYKSTVLSKDGYKGIWSQKYAFVSDKAFTVPRLTFEYFDIESKQLKKLESKEIRVDVVEGFKRETLLDSEGESTPFNYDFLYYVLTFIAGYFVSKIRFKRETKKHSTHEAFCKKIKKVKTIDEMLFLLAIQKSSKYLQIILKIESKELTSLEKIKKLIGC